MPKLVMTFATTIDLLTHVYAVVARSPRCRPLDLINRLGTLNPELNGLTQEARAVLTWELSRLYGNQSPLNQAQRLAGLDAAIESLRSPL